MATILELQDVGFNRQERGIFAGMSFGLASGEMTALVGPNGVGKSTLLAMISGLLPHYSGKILLNGRSVGDWGRKELSRTVALVPQSLHVPFAFRVEEIVSLGRAPYVGRFGKLSSHDVEVIEQSMAAVDVHSLRRRVFDELSGGEMQRVKIAIALAQQPKLMLLDEPTQHLDVGRQIEIVQLLRRLSTSGITILAAMHDLELVRCNFRNAILLSPEPSCFAGMVKEILRPELIEQAFGLKRNEFHGHYTDRSGEDVLSQPHEQKRCHSPQSLNSRRKR
jgi:iron complex transport system ATP-binding protein